MENKQCLECKDEFSGRSDKKFCCADCRTTYHNRHNSDSSKFMRNVNNILRKNRRILAEFNPNGKSKIHRTKLLDQGFKFAYFTNLYNTKNGNTYHFVYDQGYLMLDDGWLALVRKKEYVE